MGMERQIRIFDTTLRDGKQCPGASMNAREKLEVAHQLARLRVDVIEAGFPFSSPGDFESVRQIAREVRGPILCGLALAKTDDTNATGEKEVFDADLEALVADQLAEGTEEYQLELSSTLSEEEASLTRLVRD